MSLGAALDILNDERCRCRWPYLGTCNFCEAQKEKARAEAGDKKVVVKKTD